MNFPVAYPHTGPHHLLLWRCRSSGHSVVLARSLAGVLATWRRIVADKAESPDVARFARVAIVGPPAAFVAAWRVRHHVECVEDFADFLRSRAAAMYGKRTDLPSPFARCETSTDAEPDPEHYDCRACQGTKIRLTVAPEELYAAARTTWEAQGGGRVDRGYAPARTLDEGDPADVLVATGSFGPHCDGVVLGPLEGHERVAHFFCRVVEDLPRDALEAVVAQERSARRVRERARDDAYDAEQKRRAAREREELEALLVAMRPATTRREPA